MTEILDSAPDGNGGLFLKLDATCLEGELRVTQAMLAEAHHDGDCWCIRHGELLFRFGLAEGAPAFGPDGFFTHNPEALEEVGRYVREQDARREARRTEQEGR